MKIIYLRVVEINEMPFFVVVILLLRASYAVMGSFRFSGSRGKTYDPFVSFTMRYLAIDCASIEPLDVFSTLDFFIPLTSRPFRI